MKSLICKIQIFTCTVIYILGIPLNPLTDSLKTINLILLHIPIKKSGISSSTNCTYYRQVLLTHIQGHVYYTVQYSKILAH